ncbi:MAG: crossover junction endodeoxyribonuclease RuvC [Desulfovibrionaceae bacterium]|jgi:crossover junction endodeoxyribonuclease RuvC|nr:crossover junction endodeoxyribonuclease RuvC [Desulfovibrionaceae bacterium]
MRGQGRGVVVLGIDPGTRITGYGVVAEESGSARLVAVGTIRPPANAPMERRLAAIFKGVSELIAAHAPDEAALEEVFTARNVGSALKLGQARGAILAACGLAGVPVVGYEPTKIKKAVVGQGRAEKDQVAFMVAQILGQRNPGWAVDASDALAAAVCHLNTRRLNRLAGVAGAGNAPKGERR